MRKLGVHTSIAGGLHRSVERAHALGCTTVQIFSHNPRGWAVKSISQEEAAIFKSMKTHFDVSPVYIHTSYLINMASRDSGLKKKSINLLVIEMDRADTMGADYVVLHPGSASGDDQYVSRSRAVNALNEVAAMGQWNAGLLIENTAGEKGDISSTIENLSDIINGVKESLIKGICIDTCHAFAAGYDIRNDKGIQNFSDKIEKYIGLDNVKLIHLNDSKGDIGSGVDRHEHIGIGQIGSKGLKIFICYSSFRNIPLILETPKKRESDDSHNLRKVRKMIRSLGD
ncbi:MAG: deoxyribonuclease IV [Nitrospirota bacterium]|nr:deoxyribonuclease IV [Nitrospirota bacterium]MDH5768059.1 deoxyribonuclease IV [Nitrospirota bacterium]